MTLSLRYIAFICSLLVVAKIGAVEVTVEVLTKSGSALRNTVVYLEPQSPVSTTKTTSSAIMDQVNSQFVPHILVVQKGTLIDFPNSDSIKHHVYSFSPAKTFELQLYKDKEPAPQLFDQAGRVEMGCNVHDWMLGYIYVVDTPFFGKTNKHGIVTLDVPAGEYRVQIRQPRIQDDLSTLVQSVSVVNKHAIQFNLTKTLLPSRDLFEQNLDDFSDYD